MPGIDTIDSVCMDVSSDRGGFLGPSQGPQEPKQSLFFLGSSFPTIDSLISCQCSCSCSRTLANVPRNGDSNSTYVVIVDIILSMIIGKGRMDPCPRGPSTVFFPRSKRSHTQTTTAYSPAIEALLVNGISRLEGGKTSRPRNMQRIFRRAWPDVD